MREIERYLVLQVVDVRWREHLEAMEYLREGIHLRAMAQKDPLVRVPRRGARACSRSSAATIREEVLRYLFHVEIEREEAQAAARPAAGNDDGGLSTSTSSSQAPTRSRPRVSAQGSGRDGGARAALGATSGRSSGRERGRRVGRNDPCRCGSGKKYKSATAPRPTRVSCSRRAARHDDSRRVARPERLVAVTGEARRAPRNFDAWTSSPFVLAHRASSSRSRAASVGCGRGQSGSGRLARAGYDVVAIDPVRAREDPRSPWQARLEPTSAEARTFDARRRASSLHHVGDLGAALDRIVELLAAGRVAAPRRARAGAADEVTASGMTASSGPWPRRAGVASRRPSTRAGPGGSATTSGCTATTSCGPRSTPASGARCSGRRMPARLDEAECRASLPWRRPATATHVPDLLLAQIADAAGLAQPPWSPSSTRRAAAWPSRDVSPGERPSCPPLRRAYA